MCKAWDEFIKDRVWKSAPGLKALKTKLTHRWTNYQPNMDKLGWAKEEITGLFCNDNFIFCGQKNGEVGVYGVSTGEWIRDLETEYEWEESSETLVAGRGSVVAAVSWERLVSVWNTKGGKDQLTSYYHQSHHCEDDSCDCQKGYNISAIKVVDDQRVVLVLKQRRKSTVMVLTKGEDGWDVKGKLWGEARGCCAWEAPKVTLGCQGDFFCPCGEDNLHFLFGSARTKCEDWCGHDEAEVTFDVDGIASLFQESPFLILARRKFVQDSRFASCGEWSTALQVYDLESHQEMKSILLSGSFCDLLTNESVVVTVTRDINSRSALIYIYNKKMLLDPKIPPEAIRTQKISAIYPSSEMSISRSRIVFSPNNQGQERIIYALNFWLERDVKEDDESHQEAE